MEKQGIITGIGNEITPEIDAVINEYIVGKNTILKGLELNGNILSAGTCILCGYRGTLENSQTVDGNYVYGKFVIGVNETDSFSIITSSNSTEPTDGIINPTSITSAGIYYLRLYANGVSQVDSERYPKQAHTSDRARDLIADGTIYSTATTPTAPLNDNSKRVANTEYVHKQIQEELGEETTTINVYGAGSQKIVATMTLHRRAKYVKGVVSPTGESYQGGLSFTLPNTYIPKETFNLAICYRYGGNTIWTMRVTVNAYSSTISNQVVIDDLGTQGLQSYSFGYECQ